MFLKTPFLVILIVTLAAAPLLCAEEAPRIVFDSVNYDFGRVNQGENVVHRFVFRNRGGGDLEIERVRSSCGCTSTLLSANTILPGKKGEIKATFSTRGRKGRQSKSITVVSNDPDNSRVRLTISGEIVLALNLIPPRLSLRDVIFGEGESARVGVELSEDCEHLEITEVISTSPHIEAEVEDMVLPREKGGGRGWIGRLFRRKKKEKEGPARTTLRVRVRPEAPKGRLFGKVIIKYKDGKKGETALPVYARIVGNIAAKPERLFFGSISPEKGKEVSIVVTDRRGRKLVITRMEAGTVLLEVRREPIDISSIRCIVKVKPGAPPGVIRGCLKLFTDDDGESVLEVPYSGNVRPKKRVSRDD